MPGTRRRGRPRISWRDNIGDWTGMLMKEVLSSVYKTVTDGDELFTMQPNFRAKIVQDKTTANHSAPHQQQPITAHHTRQDKTRQ